MRSSWNKFCTSYSVSLFTAIAESVFSSASSSLSYSQSSVFVIAVIVERTGKLFVGYDTFYEGVVNCIHISRTLPYLYLRIRNGTIMATAQHAGADAVRVTEVRMLQSTNSDAGRCREGGQDMTYRVQSVLRRCVCREPLVTLAMWSAYASCFKREQFRSRRRRSSLSDRLSRVRAFHPSCGRCIGFWYV